MNSKVGIPRGLFFYKYYPLWKTFFEELGAEIVVSDITNKSILDSGVKTCVDEACLPVKLFHGHVINLADRVDYLFIPRFTSISRNEYVCPEFGGLPDMVRHTVNNLPTVINTEVNLRKSSRNAWKAALETGNYLTSDKTAIRKAYNKAVICYRQFRKEIRNGKLPFSTSGNIPGVGNTYGNACKNANGNTTGNVCRNASGNAMGDASGDRRFKIAVIGHAYNIYDKYVNMGLLDKLQKYDAEIITVEMMDESIINQKASALKKPMFWNFGRKALGSAFHIIEKGGVDGIIYVMSFGCGIDSFVCDLIERKVKRNTDIPFIILTIDEHSGEAGINTRLEAFIDMIGWRKTNENNVSTSG